MVSQRLVDLFYWVNRFRDFNYSSLLQYKNPETKTGWLDQHDFFLSTDRGPDARVTELYEPSYVGYSRLAMLHPAGLETWEHDVIVCRPKRILYRRGSCYEYKYCGSSFNERRNIHNIIINNKQTTNIKASTKPSHNKQQTRDKDNLLPAHTQPADCETGNFGTTTTHTQ